eukprot:TRINITY_DN15285_c0_g1_i2.p1 TRINITY_DN15285_c0_g1~~TRINITY_DN15285_c0_g1_i2.p1  ORF type:complete len:279 (+),score=81.54 TRINITY_DN15285_c0_g1_i2:43-879(+)
MSVVEGYDEVLQATKESCSSVEQEMATSTKHIKQAKEQVTTHNTLKRKHEELKGQIAKRRSRCDELKHATQKQKELAAEKAVRREVLMPEVATMKENQFSLFAQQVRNERKEILAEKNKLKDVFAARVKTVLESIADKTGAKSEIKLKGEAEEEEETPMSHLIFSKLGTAPRSGDMLNLVYKSLFFLTKHEEKQRNEERKIEKQRQDREERAKRETEKSSKEAVKNTSRWGRNDKKEADLDSSESSYTRSASSSSRTRSSSVSSRRSDSDEELARPQG